MISPPQIRTPAKKRTARSKALRLLRERLKKAHAAKSWQKQP